MHARSGAFNLSPDKVEDAIQLFREEYLPRYREQSGYKGFTLLANRDTGKVMGISFWESESDIRGSDELGRQARDDIQQQGEGRGEIERVDWEVALDDMV